jgi:hypothetical protein
MNPFEDFLTGQRLAGHDALPTKPQHGSEAGIGRQTLEMAENALSGWVVSAFEPMA